MHEWFIWNRRTIELRPLFNCDNFASLCGCFRWNPGAPETLLNPLFSDGFSRLAKLDPRALLDDSCMASNNRRSRYSGLRPLQHDSHLPRHSGRGHPTIDDLYGHSNGLDEIPAARKTSLVDAGNHPFMDPDSDRRCWRLCGFVCDLNLKLQPISQKTHVYSTRTIQCQYGSE